MASPAVALAVPNGVPTPSPMHVANNDFDSSQTINAAASTKRKRELSDDDGKHLNGADSHGRNTPFTADPSTASIPTIIISSDTVRDYFTLLERLDITPSILQRPLTQPEPDPTEEPEAKRQKSVDTRSYSITDKVAHNEYRDVNTLVLDIRSALEHQIAELRRKARGESEDAKSSDSTIAKTLHFKKKAHELFLKELSYNRPAEELDILKVLDAADDWQSGLDGNIVLSVFGEAPKSRQLFSSLQLPGNDRALGSPFLPLREIGLPNGVKIAKAVPYTAPPPVDKDKKPKTLGELFPAPRNLPSLPPPKAPKSTTKGVHVGFHRPELTEKSKYRAGSFFSQPLSTGRWLDYSNASPTSQSMTRQRERALSLAGNKPSSTEMETSELESLFRGAFSSFAPSKDDSAAMVSSGLISQTMWWQKVGQRNFDRLIESESHDSSEDEDKAKASLAGAIDENLLQEAIENWDDNAIDPSLEEACCPTKSDAEKDTDEVLQEVSDLIQTLISYQRNRNLTLPSPSSQSRYAADPAQSDMLTNGTPVQPGEEETATYEALKAQLALIIQTLPPFAVARLNSDKLEELNVSMKMEIRTDEFQGIMEETEAAARARMAQNPVPTPTPRPVSHRPSTTSTTVPYGQQYHGSAQRPPLPTPPFYPSQTPTRPPQTVRQPQTMPAYSQQRTVSNTGYRPPSGYSNTGYQQHKPVVPPYSQQPAFRSTPTPSRPSYTPQTTKQQLPGYHNMGRLANAAPQPRYQQSYQATQPQQQHYTPHQSYQPHQQTTQTSSHSSYGGYTNGTGSIPPRSAAASPHMPQQQPHSPHMPQQNYNGTTPSRQPSSFNSQSQMVNNQARPYYAQGNTPNPATHNGQMPNQQYASNQHNLNSGTSSFQTSLNANQVQQAVDQATARFKAHQDAQRTTEHLGSPVGLGGIGLGLNGSAN